MPTSAWACWARQLVACPRRRGHGTLRGSPVQRIVGGNATAGLAVVQIDGGLLDVAITVDVLTEQGDAGTGHGLDDGRVVRKRAAGPAAVAVGMLEGHFFELEHVAGSDGREADGSAELIDAE